MKRHDVGISCLVFVCSLMLCSSASAQWGTALKKLGKAAADASSNSKKPSTKPADTSPGVAESPSADSSKSKPADSNDKSASSGSSSDAAPASNAAASDTDTAGQPNLSAVRIDFVPGEKTVFFDDFSDMAPDEPPPHWKVRGGSVDLMMGSGIRQLTISKPPETRLTSPSVAVPKNFTFESEIVPHCALYWRFADKADNTQLALQMGPPPAKQGVVEINLGSLGKDDATVDGSRPIQLNLWMQEGRARVYANGTRIIDVNQVSLEKPIDHVELSWPNWGGCSGTNGVRSVRIAESTPDASSMLSSTGKYVTHGIYFDVNSDHLKPESAPVIKQVAAALIKNPNLKLEVDGFTDSTGDSSKNVDLSKKRAAAVQEVLVSQFGIDAARLKSNGFGADKPIASNDTPDGRAQNRRVEFVKQ